MHLKWDLSRNISMLTDFYELTMSNGYLDHDMQDAVAYFDLYFRSVPESGGYALMAGVEQMIYYLQNLRFSDDDIRWLQQHNVLSREFLEYLRAFEFQCDVWAIPEGTPIFPGEPIVKVVGPLIQAQMIETMLLLTINHQSLIATKTARIVRSAKGRGVMEFGARRAQGGDAAVLGARAAYIAGAAGTSCTIAGQAFGIPVAGTMAHSWVQSFSTEYDAFAAYARSFPDATILLVDTYNTLRSGVPNAIRVAYDILKPMGKRLKGIRIDSGDLTYLSIRAREMLDASGLDDCKITLSNSMDEYLIHDLIQQGAQVDSFGVGERLITSRAEPVFSGVYKLSALSRNGVREPKMKVSDNIEKVTNPDSKEVWRFYDRETGFALADLITIEGEVIDDSQDITIFDPVNTWKTKTLSNFRAEKLLKPIFVKGKLVYDSPGIEEIRAFCAEQLGTLWESIKRFENPQTYYVDLYQ